MSVSAQQITDLGTIVGPNGALTDTADMSPYLHEERGLMESRAEIVLRPSSTKEVAEAVKYCAAHNIPIVPLGGATGLVCGGVADGGVVISTDRLNKIIEVDALNHTMTVEAGVILADIQNAAEEAECLFPLSLGAEGSCRIGGNLSTNAGGVGVLRYGNTRELILGLEVVLPDGQIWNGLNGLRKDNTGYDLKQLFIGAEGTLGIVTRAVLKLYPMPRSRVTAMAALPNIEAILDLFSRTRNLCGDRLTAFEMLPAFGLDITTKHIDGVIDPFGQRYDYYTLMELTSPRANDSLREEIESVLEQAFEDGVVVDAAFAENETQALNLWRIRESMPEAQTREGASVKHDVSVPVARTVEFIIEANSQIEAACPGIRVCPFGHIGDGNIHYNLTQPIGTDGPEFLARWTEFNRIVHDLVVDMNGSISAEHGIGLLKREELEHYASAVEIELMRKIKNAIDPKNIMNPGKVVQA